MVEINIRSEEQHQRLDRFLKKYLPNASLSHIYKMIRRQVKVNGKRVSPDYMLQEGDGLILYLPTDAWKEYTEDKKKKYQNARKQFTVIYEDDNILLVNKPKGLLTHGDQKEKKNTLVNQVVQYLVDKGDFSFSKVNTFVPAAANRLDRNTSGLVLFGKTYSALQCLNQMIREKNRVGKYYLTIVHGDLPTTRTLVSGMRKDAQKNQVQVTREMGDDVKRMETVVEPLWRKGGYTLIRAKLITGRTHQIRAQLASEQLYILGDGKYGDPTTNTQMRDRFGLTTQLLHGYQLAFQDCPEELSYLDGKIFTAPLPKDFDRIKKYIYKEV